jgi:hypothetical protein
MCAAIINMLLSSLSTGTVDFLEFFGLFTFYSKVPIKDMSPQSRIAYVFNSIVSIDSHGFSPICVKRWLYEL